MTCKTSMKWKRGKVSSKKKKEAQENYVQLLSQDAEIFDVCLEYM